MEQLSTDIPTLIKHIRSFVCLFYSSNVDFWEAEQLITIERK